MKRFFIGIYILLWIAGYYAGLYWIGQNSRPYDVWSHFLFPVFLAVFSMLLRPNNSRLNLVYCAVASLISGVLAVVLGYCVKIGGPVNGIAMGAVLQTDEKEALEYLAENFFSHWYGLFFLAGAGSTWAALRASSHIQFPPLHALCRIPLLVIMGVSLCYLPSTFRITRDFKHVSKSYQKELRVLEALMERLSDGHELEVNKTGGGDLHVIVLGESASRDFMQAYGYTKPTGPWMAGMRSDPGWTLFTQAYSCHVNTVPTVLAAMEKGNTYTGLHFPTDETIIGYSRSAGMKTYWLSNQIRLSRMGTPITALAQMAESVVFTNQGTGPLGWSPSDHALLEPFRNVLAQIEETESALIVLHLVGSHIPYDARVRKGSWPDPVTDADTLNNYELSLRLTDNLLREVHGMLKERKGQAVTMTYLSDHGEDPSGHAHNADMFTWPMARIPFAVWLSDIYRDQYPDRAAQLALNSDRVITNDLLFDLYTGLAGIQFPGRSASLDISDPAYSLTREKAATLYGEIPLSEEPSWKASNSDTNAARTPSPPG